MVGCENFMIVFSVNVHHKQIVSNNHICENIVVTDRVAYPAFFAIGYPAGYPVAVIRISGQISRKSSGG